MPAGSPCPDEVENFARLVGGNARVLSTARVPGRSLVLIPVTSAPRYPFLAGVYRNVRVGRTPELVADIDSVTYTGTCLRPSCTAIVWPTMSG